MKIGSLHFRVGVLDKLNKLAVGVMFRCCFDSCSRELDDSFGMKMLKIFFSLDKKDKKEKEPESFIIWKIAMEGMERAHGQFSYLQPDRTRIALPNFLDSEIIVTLTLEEWEDFLKRNSVLPDINADIDKRALKMQADIRFLMKSLQKDIEKISYRQRRTLANSAN